MQNEQKFPHAPNGEVLHTKLARNFPLFGPASRRDAPQVGQVAAAAPFWIAIIRSGAELRFVICVKKPNDDDYDGSSPLQLADSSSHSDRSRQGPF